MPSPPALFDIHPQLSTPIYRQVVEQVQRLVAGGQLGPGDELPSVRAVAERHAINPMTVSKAYSLLEAQGLLERRRGVGMVVAEGVQTAGPRADRLALLAPALQIAAQQAAQLGIEPEAALAAFERALQQTNKEQES
ncbi:MAG: GntR family transcriptional regulator [Burkholderiales bacterium]|jgi:GntR family transcriptional regulator|nr:GntR family transcriptional regulator [Burkholderiales bacterium]